jgi:hypothetical protein
MLTRAAIHELVVTSCLYDNDVIKSGTRPALKGMTTGFTVAGGRDW